MSRAAPLISYVNHAEDLVSRLRMDLPARRRGAVVVEGVSDQAVLSRAFSIDRRTVFPVDGRVNVLSVAELMRESPLPGVVCVADRDFARDAEVESLWFLVFYDDADLEAMLLHTSVLELFLEEWASNAKLDAAGGTGGVRERIINSLTPISILRSESVRRGWSLTFDELDFDKVLDKRTLAVHEQRLCDRIRKGTGQPSTAELIDVVANHPAPICPATGRVLINGHDAMAAVGIALRQVIGALSHQQISGRFVERSVRRMTGPGDLDDTAFALRFRAAREAAAIPDA